MPAQGLPKVGAEGTSPIYFSPSLISINQGRLFMPVLNIEGTYQFDRREHPDGTVQRPPDVNGMLTFANGVRNFSILWTDEKGNFYSECYVARYRLTETEYSETPEYLIIDDQIQGKRISYDLSHRTAASPVSTGPGSARFALPQPFEQALSITVEVDGNGLKADIGGQFVDYFKKLS